MLGKVEGELDLLNRSSQMTDAIDSNKYYFRPGIGPV